MHGVSYVSSQLLPAPPGVVICERARVKSKQVILVLVNSINRRYNTSPALQKQGLFSSRKLWKADGFLLPNKPTSYSFSSRGLRKIPYTQNFLPASLHWILSQMLRFQDDKWWAELHLVCPLLLLFSGGMLLVSCVVDLLSFWNFWWAKNFVCTVFFSTRMAM